MKRRTKKLSLNRETLRHLDDASLAPIAGGRADSIQSGETYCWCTDTCNCDTTKIETAFKG